MKQCAYNLITRTSLEEILTPKRNTKYPLSLEELLPPKGTPNIPSP
jgi:hypothetical protein